MRALAALALVVWLGCPGMAAAQSAQAPVVEPLVVATWPHDTQAFTQGLVFHGDRLFESTGLYGRSAIAERTLYSREPVDRVLLPTTLFGEGLAVVGDRLYQLTWRARRGLVFDTGLRKRGEFTYEGEGWGLTHDGTHLIRSDGSHRLFVHATEDFAQLGHIDVMDGNRPVRRLNELEWIDGLIYANVWQTRRIAVIAPDTGRVVRWLDLSGLQSATLRRGDTSLNGIAWHAKDRRLFVTGKQWGAIYEIADPALQRTEAGIRP